MYSTQLILKRSVIKWDISQPN